MEKHYFNKFYRVFMNDTVVTEVSFNDSIRLVHRSRKKLSTELVVGDLRSDPLPTYSLPQGNEMYYGYKLKTQAMEMAKAGALKHIAMLIAEGAQSTKKVYQYRFDHYEDLNVNLKDSTIKNFKSKNI